jgi:putative acetyltransferase
MFRICAPQQAGGLSSVSYRECCLYGIMSEMEIRKIREGEEKELWELFYNTVHNINIRDYDEKQIAAWAPDDLDINIAMQKYREIDPFVVIEEGKIIAYADIQSDGYIDHFFCHHEFQGQGVGSALFGVLKKVAGERDLLEMYSDVSITARPFFEAMGFSVEKEQFIRLGDQKLKNYRMVCKHSDG